MDTSKVLLQKRGEFQFWNDTTPYILLALIASFIEVFDIPVYMPILLLYFLFMTWKVCQRQKEHMKKYGYGVKDFFVKKDLSEEDERLNNEKL